MSSGSEPAAWAPEPDGARPSRPRVSLATGRGLLGALDGAIAFVLSLPIRLYRITISPLLPQGVCRFHPSCSAYALEALKVHGALRGTLLTLWRLLRCQPFCDGGLDPVPPRRHRG